MTVCVSSFVATEMLVTLRIVSYLSLGSCFMFITFFMIILIIFNFLPGLASRSCADSGWRIEIFSFGESSFPFQDIGENISTRFHAFAGRPHQVESITRVPRVLVYSIKRVNPKSTVATLAVARTACLLF